MSEPLNRGRLFVSRRLLASALSLPHRVEIVAINREASEPGYFVFILEGEVPPRREADSHPDGPRLNLKLARVEIEARLGYAE